MSTKSIVIIQGPLYDTCIDYIIKMTNDIPCIISTWNNEDISKINLLKKSAIDVVINNFPQYNGVQNVNYAKTAIAGLQEKTPLKKGIAYKAKFDDFFWILYFYY
jgi:formylmethanofuran dehydrogenase subunit A